MLTKSKRFIILYFVVALSLVIAWTNIDELNDTNNPSIIRDGHKPALAVVNPQIILPQYKTADVLLEDLGGPPVELLPANISPNNQFLHFAIIEDAGTYYLWLNTSLHQDFVIQANRPSVEQRFESTDGLVWRNRTDTDLVRNEAQKYLMGLREVHKSGGLYEGWEHYYYESSSGWGVSFRYVTSNDGISWTVVNDPALIGSHFLSVARDGANYELWAHPDGDGNFTGDASLRYRTSANPGSGWGNWLNGGTKLDLDGTGEAPKSFTRVRKTASNTYELFYMVIPQYHLNKATSIDGINFTTVVTNMIEFNTVMPTIVNNIIRDFAVVDIGGEDWIYFTYCEARDAIGNCTDSNIAVSRPVYAEIEVLDGAVNVPDNTGLVDFGTTPVGVPIIKTFTVTNTGEGDLTLTTPITLPVGFSVVNSFGTTTVPFNTSTTFEVQLDATAIGVFSGTLAFDNNDMDETPYNFTITGTVVAATPGYGSTPGVGSTINVGSVVIGNTTSANLTVQETGTAQLDVGVPGGGLLSGANAGDFAIVNGPPFSIADGGANQVVTIQCTPSGTGLHTATLSFTSNDPAQATVSYTLNCTGTAAPAPPTNNSNDDDDDDDDDGDGGSTAPPSAQDLVIDCWPWQVIVPVLAVPGAKVECIPMFGEALPAPSVIRHLEHSAEITIRDAAGVPVHQFNPPLKVCFHYTEAELVAVGGEASDFQLQTYRDERWERLGTRLEGSPSGAVQGRVCALVDHLTLFGLFENKAGGEASAENQLAEVKYLPETGLPPIFPWPRVIGGVLAVLFTLTFMFGIFKWRRK